MLDLALNSDFSVFLNENGDLGTVSGREEFEQSVVILMTELMRSSAIGEFDQSTIEQKLKLEATRVARKHDFLTDISGIDVSPHKENPHTYVVSIDYKSDRIFEENISG
ncbi:T4 gp25-like baseplate wedge protein [Halorubrum tailed virus 10]|uniref:T4 gp25-like baseplate wedge protein n=1 Tax=Halorubrum tailed virus 10 TaxID=2877991 RepID=A0AAE8XTD0_9CAUD|nr:T4 gp25-like baseplate wedge protein [Halorubrum tailed virus 10]UBF19612.1 T4 gp25-like baseplate wedge protein [Halorubrum tailed virus 10]